MTSQNKNKRLGFTAVELLVTLFIGTAFIIIGYRLYVTIIKDGSEIRARANASNIANDYMKQRAASDLLVCSATAATFTETPPVNTNIVVISVISTVTAPQPCDTSNNILKVKTTVKYKLSGIEKEVSSAIYISK